MLENVVVVGGYRTYIGKENGIYRHIPAEKLGGHILHKLSGDYGAPDLVLAGNAVGAGGNIGRLMALEAGIPEEVPAFTIDSQCSSGMEAIVMAAAKIGSGQQQVVFAGGAESSSTAPRRMVSENHPEYNGEKIYTAAKFSPGEWRQDAMLWGAEKTAKMAGVSRRTLDAWALRSQQLAVKARDTKVFEDVILPLGTKRNAIREYGKLYPKHFWKRFLHFMRMGSRRRQMPVGRRMERLLSYCVRKVMRKRSAGNHGFVLWRWWKWQEIRKCRHCL